ncbi:hypothetical protein SELMODRAFT_91270 [Selaginella moellendorffii]|uniref:Aminotransferase class V domain-containing protein n=1 Tax=Selaginella moellendorffii TaxID=88036 RepID=D8REE5_SELML|nr:uncharacterized protein LOC9660612 [Selaginella moellendorffii]EFJ29428.1 hypothetical protein SELMODRAFT_91270 [Selaginella moellendorffii]|eukprot:XP_002969340.1 uncharacterized protein LOC9660612 [Selaginella moellendorffii]
MGSIAGEEELQGAGDCGGCCGIGRVYVKEDDPSQPAQWRECSLGFSEICKAELVPDALFQAKIDGAGAGAAVDDAKCAWLRSQLIGSGYELSTPFGKRDLFYADYTASGRCLFHIESFITQNIMPFYGNTHAEDSFVGDTTSFLVNESTRYLKHSLGATADDALLFCGSGCTAAVKRLQEVMGLAVPSILRDRVVKTLKDEERWVVFIGPFEHHSNLLSWRQSLAEVVEVPTNKQGLLDVEFLDKALADPKFAGRPKLGSFSACSNVTGILADTRAIARQLHRHGALACFDFASCGPYVRIEMRAGELDGYDAIALSPHKFVGGPGTPGLLLINKNLYLLRDKAPSTPGGGAVDFVNGYTEEDTLYLRDIEAREDAGTPPILQKIKAALAFWIKEEMGYELIESREQYFITTALKRLSANPNVMLLGNTEAKRAAILSFLVYATEPGDQVLEKRKILQGRFIVKLLDDLFGIQSRGGCSCAGPYGHALLNVDHNVSIKLRDAIQRGYGGVRLGWARLNFAYFMSIEEFEFVLSAIEFVAEYGQRFIPLYEFNWRSGAWTFMPEFKSKYAALAEEEKLEDELPEVKHKTYLETAISIAKLLPEHPQERDVPKYIDPVLVDFRV